MGDQYCPCTGCAPWNTECGLKLWPGTQTCGKEMRQRGAAYYWGVCASCLCKTCGEHPCDCHQSATHDGGWNALIALQPGLTKSGKAADASGSSSLITWQHGSGKTGKAAWSWHPESKGKGEASWTCQPRSPTQSWLNSGVMQHIRDLQNRTESIEYEIKELKNAMDMSGDD